MAKKTETVVTLTDDLDGTKADRTVAFSFDGTNYELELSKKNATAFEKALQPYLEASRRVRIGGSGARRSGSGARARSRSDLGDIRQWARDNNIEVTERGRISQSVQDAYDAAH